MAVSAFSLRRRILFHETDLAGIVHFSNFFKLMEECEHALYRSLGLSVHPPPAPMTERRRGWPRVSCRCDYHAPLLFEEEVEIELRVLEVRGRSIRYRFYFWKDPDGERRRAATGEMAIVYVEGSYVEGRMTAQPLPPEFREKLAAHPEVPE